MTPKQFIEKYLGKFVDFDGYYGAQCVDLIQQYNKEVYGGGFIPGAAAADIWETFPTDIYDRVLNTIDAIPVMGDVIIWKKTTSLPWGHIAIVSSAEQLKFTSLDQNWPTGSACKYVEHNYNGVIGWLHPKALPNTDICKPFKDNISFKDKVIGERDATIEQLKKQLTEKDIVISSQTAELLKLKEDVVSTTEQLNLTVKELAAKEELRAKWYGLYQQSQETLSACQKDRTTFQRQLTECINKGELTWGDLILKIWNKIKGQKI